MRHPALRYLLTGAGAAGAAALLLLWPSQPQRQPPSPAPAHARITRAATWPLYDLHRPAWHPPLVEINPACRVRGGREEGGVRTTADIPEGTKEP